MSNVSFFSEMLQAISDRGRRLLTAPVSDDRPIQTRMSVKLACETLLSDRGEASGIALAGVVLDHWIQSGDAARRDFMRMLLESFGPDAARLEQALDSYSANPCPETLLELHTAAEPRRQELIRRLNLAPRGTATLVSMRGALLDMQAEMPDLGVVDADFAHLFASWFNRGFLMLRSIDWATPADILERIIRYEAVHHIGSWDELRMRLAPKDRRCFAFFHPQLPDDPLIFVEVALTSGIPERIDEILIEDREQIAADAATTAVFYSISNCQPGLKGISFGNFLIKQVVEDLRREFPRLETFVTLSPVPGFARWLARERQKGDASILGADLLTALDRLDEPEWFRQDVVARRLQPAIEAAAARYFLDARDAKGRLPDPVARFHLGNGARLERINFRADLSARALRDAHGLMVNYLYDLAKIEENHQAFARRGVVAASDAVRFMSPVSPGRARDPGRKAAVR